MSKQNKKLIRRVRADFIRQFKNAMKARGVNQTELANRMGIHKSGITRLMNPDSNVRLKTMIRMVRALGLKLGIVALHAKEDISGEIVVKCWEQSGKPRDLWDLQSTDS